MHGDAKALYTLKPANWRPTARHHGTGDKRNFQEETIRAYAETARPLDLWMAEEDIDGDFTACSVDVLNQFFAAYRNAHSQGGANTRQRNLHHLFKWLALRYNHPDPWADDMVRYGPEKSRPSTLAEDFIRDLLEVTGGGNAKSFVDARDHGPRTLAGFELVWLVAGSARWRSVGAPLGPAPGNVLDLGPGDMLLIPPGLTVPARYPAAGAGMGGGGEATGPFGMNTDS
jgi:hypothetical protein